MSTAPRPPHPASRPVSLALAAVLALFGLACGGGTAARPHDAGTDVLAILDEADGGSDDAYDARPAHADAPVDAGACWAADECDAPAACVAQGEETCAPCPKPTADCSSDSECAESGPTWICESVACGCFRECMPGCTNDSSCPAWTICGADHRCGPKPCGGDAGLCPADFRCADDGHCVRKTCSDDGDCSGACVKGLCYNRPGVCTTPPPS
jgi:hypothetical protein